MGHAAADAFNGSPGTYCVPLHLLRSGMNVVQLTAADAARYRSLMLHAYEHAADAFTSTAEERAAEPMSWWERRIADPRGMGVALGAFDDDRLVGTVALEFSAKPKTRHKVTLIGMFVSESFRGLGVGGALLRAALDCAKARPGALTMTLTVTQGNERAISLYKAFGFQEFGIEPMAMFTAGGYKAKVHMWRNIGDAEAGPDAR